MNGSDILVLLDRGTAETPDYQVVGCQRDSIFEEMSDMIDNSCKTSRAQRVDPGRFSGSISLDFLYIETDSNRIALRNANRNGEKVVLARREEGIILQRATAKIDSISDAFPDWDASTVAAAFTIDGFVSDVWIIGEGDIGGAFIG